MSGEPYWANDRVRHAVDGARDLDDPALHAMAGELADSRLRLRGQLVQVISSVWRQRASASAFASAVMDWFGQPEFSEFSGACCCQFRGLLLPIQGLAAANYDAVDGVRRLKSLTARHEVAWLSEPLVLARPAKAGWIMAAASNFDAAETLPRLRAAAICRLPSVTTTGRDCYAGNCIKARHAFFIFFDVGHLNGPSTGVVASRYVTSNSARSRLE